MGRTLLFPGRGSRRSGTDAELLIPALILLLTLPSLLGADPRSPELEALQLRSFSGTPLLLEIALREDFPVPGKLIARSGGDMHTFTLLEPPPEHASGLRLSPYLVPGRYELEFELEALKEGGATLGSWSYTISFAEFVWGRDNYRFGNNADYESVIGDYSEILSSWLEERFDLQDPGDRVILTDLMYSLFGRNSGRCYAFSVSQLSYLLDPDSLPEPYESVYDIRPGVSRIQREMNYLQFDVVYDQILPGGGRDLQEPQANRERLVELERIMERIDRQEPVAVGVTGAELHHSMLVFGYIENHATRSVDLLVANNWKSREELNLRSRDAEMVRIYREPAEGSRAMEWRDWEGLRRRQPERMFVVEPPEGEERDPRLLKTILSRRREELSTRQEAILIVENARNAWLSQEVEPEGTEQRRTGFYRGRRREELEAVTYDRVQRTHRFALPRAGSYLLEFLDSEGVRLYLYRPESLTDRPGERVAPQVDIESTTAPGDGSVTRRYLLNEEGLTPAE